MRILVKERLGQTAICIMEILHIVRGGKEVFHALSTCTLFRIRILGYTLGVRPRIVYVSKLLKLKLFNHRLCETYWRTSEVRNPEGICI